MDVTSSLTFHFIFRKAGTMATAAPQSPPNRIAAAEWIPAGSLHAIATTIAPVVPIKNEPSAIMENCPEPKIMMTASAVNIRGAAASMIFPILRREVNGPMKKLVIAVIGSSLTMNTITDTMAQAMRMIRPNFTISTNKLIRLLLFMPCLLNLLLGLKMDTQHIDA